MLEIIDKVFREGVDEVLSEQASILNNSLNGGLTIRKEGNTKDFIRIERRLGPMAGTLSEWNKVSYNSKDFSSIMGRKMGDTAISRELIESSIMCSIAAKKDGFIVTGYGDREDKSDIDKVRSIVTENSGFVVMHSAPLYDVFKTSLTDNGTTVSVSGVGVNVSKNSFDVPVMCSDAECLANHAKGDYKTIAIDKGAIEIIGPEVVKMDMVDITKKEDKEPVGRLIGKFVFYIKINGYDYTGEETDRDGLSNPDNWRATSENS